MSISLKSKNDIEKMKIAGNYAAKVLEYLEDFVQVGISTEEIDYVAYKYITEELKEINNLLFINNKKKEVAFSDIENLTLKIQRQQEIIKLTNRQINLLNEEISQNQQTKSNLEKNLLKSSFLYVDK